MAADDSARESTRGQRRGKARRRRRVVAKRDRRMPYPLAAAAVGLLVAILARVLIFAGESACDLARGTSTCGSLGGFLLLGIAAVMFVVGTRLLRTLAIPEPGITSILGVALLAIVMLTVLLDVIFSVWMWIVLPLVAAAVYAFAAWAAARLTQMDSG